jgi:hypothetical protein
MERGVMHTAFRLLVFMPAAVFAVVIGLLGVGFAGGALPSLLLFALIVALPIGLIAWTIRDARRRRHASTDLRDRF